MSRVLTFLPWAVYTPHLETDLELIQLALDSGDEVDVMLCDADLSACDRNPSHRMTKCTYCIGKRDAGLRLLEGRVGRLPLYRLDASDIEEIRAVPTQFDSIEDLKSLHIDNFDLGYAVLASMVSYFRDPDFAAGERAAWTARLVKSSLAVYRSVQNYIDANHYARAQVFNGRFAICRAFRRACESRGVEYVVHDRGSDHGRYGLYRNTTVHDLGHMHERIESHWAKAADDPERETLARRFFDDRARGVDKRWKSHVADQTAGRLPDSWSDDKRNVVIFLSSEHEFISIGEEWKNPVYADQLDGIEKIRASFAGDHAIRIWLRVHPNLRGVDNEQTRGIARLAEDGLDVIGADSTISTYALLRAAWKVVTFGSTVGIEANYWGKVSILAGKCVYRELAGTYNATDHDDLVRLLREPLEPLPDTAALKYGFYWYTFGIPYRYYEPSGVFAGRYRGRRVRPDPGHWLGAALYKALPPVNAMATARSLARIERRWFQGDG